MSFLQKVQKPEIEKFSESAQLNANLTFMADFR